LSFRPKKSYCFQTIPKLNLKTHRNPAHKTPEKAKTSMKTALIFIANCRKTLQMVEVVET